MTLWSELRHKHSLGWFVPPTPNSMLIWIWTTMSEPGSICAGFQWTSSTPVGLQEDFRTTLKSQKIAKSFKKLVNGSIVVYRGASVQSRMCGTKYVILRWRNMLIAHFKMVRAGQIVLRALRLRLEPSDLGLYVFTLSVNPKITLLVFWSVGHLFKSCKNWNRGMTHSLFGILGGNGIG